MYEPLLPLGTIMHGPSQFGTSFPAFLSIVLTELMDGVNRSRVVVEAWHHKLLPKVVRSSLLKGRRVKGPQSARIRFLSEKLTCFLNMLSNHILNVFHARPLQGPVRLRVLEVLTVTRG